MAITFEEKNNNVRNIAIVAVIAVFLIVAGIFAWKSIQEPPVVNLIPAESAIQIRTEILDDPRLAALELFPEIPPAAAPAVRDNPFVKNKAQSATSTFVLENQPSENIAP
ncbi:MAG: hypothetical protein L7H18_01035 [Candidatus Nealsonbacteria bacterium DGGOD1a]|jgi:hypothetical protein|nr:MAG: hypothetical protein L7H18_01035 [Candidatus Nealsonbacteria bacterium DGGOD1a]